VSKADILLSNRVPTTGELLGSDSDHSGEDRNTADPSGYDFSFTHLQGTDLSGSNITAANLSGADLSCTNVSSSDLTGAVLAAPISSVPLQGICSVSVG